MNTENDTETTATSPQGPPAALSVEALTNAVTQYRQQHEQVTSQLNSLEQQRFIAMKTQDTLVGAIAALEQVLQNVKDEAATQANV